MLPAYWIVSRGLRRIIGTVGRHADRLTATAVTLNERTTEFLQGIRLIHSVARQETLVLHDHTVGRDPAALPDVGSIQEDRGVPNGGVPANVRLVDLEHAILEAVGLKHRMDRRTILDAHHVWIDYLSKAIAEHHVPPDPSPHGSQVPWEKKSAFEIRQ